jgi:hypothetical protein
MARRKTIQAQIEKAAQLPIRMRHGQRRRIDLAAAIETLRRPHKIGSGPLLLEKGMPGIDQTIASATPTELAQAEALVGAG